MKPDFRRPLEITRHREVQQITGTVVWLAIYEEWTGELRSNSIGALGVPRIGTWMGKKMANWDRDRFRVLHRFGGSDA